MTSQQRRDAAFAAINTERDYQDAQQGNARKHPKREIELEVVITFHGKPLTLGEGILVLYKLVDDARGHWYSPDGYEEALHHIRKIAGVATQLMENFGAPMRAVTGTAHIRQPADQTAQHKSA